MISYVKFLLKNLIAIITDFVNSKMLLSFSTENAHVINSIFNLILICLREMFRKKACEPTQRERLELRLIPPLRQEILKLHVPESATDSD